MSGSDPEKRAKVDAYRHERDGYVARGLWNRVAQLDALLSDLEEDDVGGEPEAAADAPALVSSRVEEAGGATARRRSGRRGG